MIPLVGQAALALRAQRGGRRRREEAVEALAGAAAPAPLPQVRPGLLPGIESELVSKLLQEWAWGDHSTAAVQRLCIRAYHDQETLLGKLHISTDNIDASLRAIAKLGAWGRYPANCYKELMGWLGDPSPPPPMRVRIPVLVSKPGRLPVQAEISTGILLPHVELANLWQRHRPIFNKFMLGLQEGCENASETFWEGCIAREDPRLHGHPVLARANWKKFAIPLALHGDGVPCVAVGKPGTKSMGTISWASMLSAGTTKFS